MAGLQGVWTQVASLFSNLFDHPDWRNVLDILLVSVVIYQVLKLFLHTRANSVVKGVAIVLVFTWLTDVLQLNTIHFLFQQVLNTGVILLIVLFQPELRRGLEQIGRTSYWGRLTATGTKQQLASEHVIDELVSAIADLSRKRIGALLVVERRTGLRDIIESGTYLDAEISAELVENIFEPNTPLHDGAVVIKDGRIVAAACILQLTQDTTLSRELGTRHRAAIGISETTDAVALIVSEETGIVSTARDGKLSRHLDKKALKVLLTELFEVQEMTIWQMLQKWKEGQTREA